MTKTYVLDTSVLLNAGKTALYGFKDATVVIPLGVVKQLELSTKIPEFSWIATSVLRELEKLRVEHSENINEGIPTEEGGNIRIEVNHVQRNDSLPSSAREMSNTLLVTSNLKSDHPDEDVTLVSNDMTQRIVAATLGISAEPFRRKTAQGEYTGVDTLYVDDNQLSEVFQNGVISSENVPDSKEYPVRHCLILKNVANAGSALVTKQPNGDLQLIDNASLEKRAVKGKSVEQKFALTHLADPDIDIVSLGGPAGTGKTLLALAEGFRAVKDPNSPIKKVIVFRPLQEVGGQELGFLPGTEDEKMLPWTMAVRDAMSVWMTKMEIDEAFRKENIEVSPATFIRGRTINNAYIIIDEAQNFERLTLLSILSRLGDKSKCVMSWDAAQRDNLYISKDDGIVAIVDRMKSERLFAHVTLTKTQRSRAAKMATDILDEMDI